MLYSLFYLCNAIMLDMDVFTIIESLRNFSLNQYSLTIYRIVLVCYIYIYIYVN